MTTADFFLKHLGKEDNDYGTVKDACVNLVKSYYVEVLGLTPFIGNANQYVNEIRIPQTLGKVPPGKVKPGDIVVFHNGNYDPINGHIGICIWSREQDFECMEQNNPVGSPCHYVYHTDFQNIFCILRPNLPENSTPRPTSSQVPSTLKFVMNYTVINTDLNLLEQARKLLVQLSGGKIDCSFTYQQLPPIHSPSLFPTDEQVLFFKNFPISTPFCFLTYISGQVENYVRMTTNEVPGTHIILTACDGVPFVNPALSVCFEMVHAIDKALQDKGVQIQDTDEYTPSEEFIQNKIQNIIPLLTHLQVV